MRKQILKKICNEIFGASNFVGEIIWQSATDNNPRQISTEHEYIVCYAKRYKRVVTLAYRISKKVSEYHYTI